MKIQKNISLAKFTTLGIGGPAKYFLVAKTQQVLIEATNWARTKNIPYLVIGGGSNLLISDQGFPGLVIKNNIHSIGLQGLLRPRSQLQSASEASPALEVQSGTPLQVLVNFTIQHGLGFIHKLIGIPGTVGGAVYGNAGAYGQTISDHITHVVILSEAKNLITLSKQQCQFDYRDSVFKRNQALILEAHFRFNQVDFRVLQQESQEILAQRLARYPWGFKCPGSFFKNIPADNIPPQTLKLIPKDKITFGKIPAGYLLESIGAKRQKLGDIQVSGDHANFFINLGDGKAADYYQLAQNLAQKVKEKFGIKLEPEVQLINLPPL